MLLADICELVGSLADVIGAARLVGSLADVIGAARHYKHVIRPDGKTVLSLKPMLTSTSSSSSLKPSAPDAIASIQALELASKRADWEQIKNNVLRIKQDLQLLQVALRQLIED